MATNKKQPQKNQAEELDIQAEIMNPESSRFTDEQLLDILNRRMTEKQIQERKKPVQVEHIEDFFDERVEVFSANAIYSVYNKDSGNEIDFTGRYIKFLFGNDIKTKKKFIEKKLGSRVEIGVYRILFKYFIHSHK